MLLKTLVKISSVNNLSDARYCAGMGVTMMGFLLDTHHAHYISPAQFKAITQWVQGVALVGELSTTDPGVVQQTLDQYAIDYLQLNDPIATRHIADLAVPLLIKLRLQGNETLVALQSRMHTYAPYAKYFLLEAACPHDAALAALQPTINHLAQCFPILQGYHVAPATLPQLLATKLQGVALQGGVETKPGYKDFDQLAAVLEELAVEQC